MADPLVQIEQMLKALRDGGRRDAEMMDLLISIKQALVDGVAALERREIVLQPAGPAPATAEHQSSWTALEIDAPVDGLGRPTGKMTIRKVK